MAYMTPPSRAAPLLVKALLVILNEESWSVYMTPPIKLSRTVVSKSTADDIK